METPLLDLREVRHDARDDAMSFGARSFEALHELVVRERGEVHARVVHPWSRRALFAAGRGDRASIHLERRPSSETRARADVGSIRAVSIAIVTLARAAASKHVNNNRPSEISFLRVSPNVFA